MARRWTEEEDEALETYASMGAVGVSAVLAAMGSRRSPHAVADRASRIGVSLTVFETCPQCGRVVRRLRRSGLCPVCHERLMGDPSGTRADLMRRMEPTPEDERALAEAVRRRSTARQRKTRDSRAAAAAYGGFVNREDKREVPGGTHGGEGA